MTLAGEGRDPGRSHMLRLAEQADVSVREAESIIAGVRDAVAQWGDFAERAGVLAATRNQIARSLSGQGM
jgi:serine/threonine-protein kinase HipA